ncbi:unnamed protein product [Pedinophyceae sp. YPF-701]|nr:unnamed protein product [Pedinophyceae sp. YPF-701]
MSDSLHGNHSDIEATVSTIADLQAMVEGLVQGSVEPSPEASRRFTSRSQLSGSQRSISSMVSEHEQGATSTVIDLEGLRFGDPNGELEGPLVLSGPVILRNGQLHVPHGVFVAASGVILEDLEIEATVAGAAAVTVRGRGAATIMRCSLVASGGPGLACVGSGADIAARSCEVAPCGECGVVARSGGCVHLQDCRVHGPRSGAAVSAEGSGSIATLEDTVVDRCTHAGLRAAGGATVGVEGGHVAGSMAAGAVADGEGTRLSLRSVHLARCATGCLVMAGATAELAGCEVSGSHSAAVVVRGRHTTCVSGACAFAGSGAAAVVVVQEGASFDATGLLVSHARHGSLLHVDDSAKACLRACDLWASSDHAVVLSNSATMYLDGCRVGGSLHGSVIRADGPGARAEVTATVLVGSEGSVAHATNGAVIDVAKSLLARSSGDGALAEGSAEGRPSSARLRSCWVMHVAHSAAAALDGGHVEVSGTQLLPTSLLRLPTADPAVSGTVALPSWFGAQATSGAAASLSRPPQTLTTLDSDGTFRFPHDLDRRSVLGTPGMEAGAAPRIEGRLRPSKASLRAGENWHRRSVSLSDAFDDPTLLTAGNNDEWEKLAAQSPFHWRPDEGGIPDLLLFRTPPDVAAAALERELVAGGMAARSVEQRLAESAVNSAHGVTSDGLGSRLFLANVELHASVASAALARAGGLISIESSEVHPPGSKTTLHAAASATGQRSMLQVRGSTFHGTPGAVPCIHVHDGATAELADVRLLCDGKAKGSSGALVSGLGASLRLSGAVIVGFAQGIVAQAGARATCASVRVQGPGLQCGIVSSGNGSDAGCLDAAVDSADVAAFRAAAGATLRLERAAATHSGSVGFEAAGSGTTLELRSCETVGSVLAGMHVHDGAEAMAEASRFAESERASGAVAEGQGTSVALLAGCKLAGNRAHGLEVVSGAHASLAACEVAASGLDAEGHCLRLDGDGSTVSASDSVFCGSAATGIFVGGGASLSLSGGAVRDCAGPCVHGRAEDTGGAAVELCNVAMSANASSGPCLLLQGAGTIARGVQLQLRGDPPQPDSAHVSLQDSPGVLTVLDLCMVDSGAALRLQESTLFSETRDQLWRGARVAGRGSAVTFERCVIRGLLSGALIQEKATCLVAGCQVEATELYEGPQPSAVLHAVGEGSAGRVDGCTINGPLGGLFAESDSPAAAETPSTPAFVAAKQIWQQRSLSADADAQPAEQPVESPPLTVPESTPMVSVTETAISAVEDDDDDERESVRDDRFGPVISGSGRGTVLRLRSVALRASVDSGAGTAAAGPGSADAATMETPRMPAPPRARDAASGGGGAGAGHRGGVLVSSGASATAFAWHAEGMSGYAARCEGAGSSLRLDSCVLRGTGGNAVESCDGAEVVADGCDICGSRGVGAVAKDAGAISMTRTQVAGNRGGGVVGRHWSTVRASQCTFSGGSSAGPLACARGIKAEVDVKTSTFVRSMGNEPLQRHGAPCVAATQTGVVSVTDCRAASKDGTGSVVSVRDDGSLVSWNGGSWTGFRGSGVANVLDHGRLTLRTVTVSLREIPVATEARVAPGRLRGMLAAMNGYKHAAAAPSATPAADDSRGAGSPAAVGDEQASGTERSQFQVGPVYRVRGHGSTLALEDCRVEGYGTALSLAAGTCSANVQRCQIDGRSGHADNVLVIAQGVDCKATLAHSKLTGSDGSPVVVATDGSCVEAHNCIIEAAGSAPAVFTDGLGSKIFLGDSIGHQREDDGVSPIVVAGAGGVAMLQRTAINARPGATVSTCVASGVAAQVVAEDCVLGTPAGDEQDVIAAMDSPAASPTKNGPKSRARSYVGVTFSPDGEPNLPGSSATPAGESGAGDACVTATGGGRGVLARCRVVAAARGVGALLAEGDESTICADDCHLVGNRVPALVARDGAHVAIDGGSAASIKAPVVRTVGAGARVIASCSTLTASGAPVVDADVAGSVETPNSKLSTDGFVGGPDAQLVVVGKHHAPIAHVQQDGGPLGATPPLQRVHTLQATGSLNSSPSRALHEAHDHSFSAQLSGVGSPVAATVPAAGQEGSVSARGSSARKAAPPLDSSVDLSPHRPLDEPPQDIFGVGSPDQAAPLRVLSKRSSGVDPFASRQSTDADNAMLDSAGIHTMVSLSGTDAHVHLQGASHQNAPAAGSGHLADSVHRDGEDVPAEARGPQEAMHDDDDYFEGDGAAGWRRDVHGGVRRPPGEHVAVPEPVLRLEDYPGDPAVGGSRSQQSLTPSGRVARHFGGDGSRGTVDSTPLSLAKPNTSVAETSGALTGATPRDYEHDVGASRSMLRRARNRASGGSHGTGGRASDYRPESVQYRSANEASVAQSLERVRRSLAGTGSDDEASSVSRRTGELKADVAAELAASGANLDMARVKVGAARPSSPQRSPRGEIATMASLPAMRTPPARARGIGRFHSMEATMLPSAGSGEGVPPRSERRVELRLSPADIASAWETYEDYQSSEGPGGVSLRTARSLVQRRGVRLDSFAALWQLATSDAVVELDAEAGAAGRGARVQQGNLGPAGLCVLMSAVRKVAQGEPTPTAVASGSLKMLGGS